MKNFEHGELAKEILMIFLIGSLVVSCAVLPGLPYIFKLFKTSNAKERGRIRQSVRGLEKQGLLQRKIKNGKEELVVTKKGERKIAEYLAEDLEIQKPKRWDKKWRIVMFDIPETKVRTRKEVSFKLKDMGMKAIQNSVFISPYPCKKEIDFIANHYFVKKYFIYFETNNIESYQDLLKIFKLN